MVRVVEEMFGLGATCETRQRGCPRLFVVIRRSLPRFSERRRRVGLPGPRQPVLRPCVTAALVAAPGGAGRVRRGSRRGREIVFTPFPVPDPPLVCRVAVAFVRATEHPVGCVSVRLETDTTTTFLTLLCVSLLAQIPSATDPDLFPS